MTHEDLAEKELIVLGCWRGAPWRQSLEEAESSSGPEGKYPLRDVDSLVTKRMRIKLAGSEAWRGRVAWLEVLTSWWH